MRTVHLFSTGQFVRRHKRWSLAYAEVTVAGRIVPGIPRYEWWALGKRDGFKCKFHPDEQTARAALLAENTVLIGGS